MKYGAKALTKSQYSFETVFMDFKMIYLGAIFFSCLILEHFFPLRKSRHHFKRRLFHNLSLTLLALPFTRLLTLPLVYGLVDFSEGKNWGLLNQFSPGVVGQILMGLILLDYSIYWWHRFNHEIPFFWRFHQVHHSDKDMDTTTALRFHFGELILSAVLRCGLALTIGFSLQTLIIFDLLVTGLTLFHHSNVKLPKNLDKVISLVLVSPRYHQTHHSFYLSETDSNYSTIFTFWDRLHRSYGSLKNPEEIVIGVPAFESYEMTLIQLIKLPFEKIKAWPLELRKRE